MHASCAELRSSRRKSWRALFFVLPRSCSSCMYVSVSPVSATLMQLSKATQREGNRPPCHPWSRPVSTLVAVSHILDQQHSCAAAEVANRQAGLLSLSGSCCSFSQSKTNCKESRTESKAMVWIVFGGGCCSAVLSRTGKCGSETRARATTTRDGAGTNSAGGLSCLGVT